MIELTGKYNFAKIFTDNVEDVALKQINDLLNEEFTKESTIRIMPDTHAGAGCTIGTTMTIHDKVVPYMVGVDIGCGMETVILNEKSIDLAKLDNVIHKRIPSGMEVRDIAHEMALSTNIHKLRCEEFINSDRAYRSVGTLGGGNHFIEVNKDDSGILYLVIHSGSRYLGKQIADHYQREAIEYHKRDRRTAQKVIDELKKEGKEKEIQKTLKKMQKNVVNSTMSWLEGELFDDYIHDMDIAQEYADINRKCMVNEIIDGMGLEIVDSFSTIHNYIDIKNRILRKGAISARKGERVLIPINMRDGSLMCTGKGNVDWNQSAPHGAGRLMSRTAARKNITLDEFEKSMKGIYSSTINSSTIDEAPFAYKPMDEIVENIKDTVVVDKILHPIYNFKASEQ